MLVHSVKVTGLDGLHQPRRVIQLKRPAVERVAIVAPRAGAPHRALGVAGLDQVDERLGWVSVTTDGYHRVAELIRSLYHTSKLGRILHCAKLGLVWLKVDGKRHDRAVIQFTAGTEHLNLLQHCLRPESFPLLNLGFREVLEEVLVFIIQAGREQPHLLLGVAQLGR